MKIARGEEVVFDEFARACDLVEGYFGETIDEVALHAPVSRRQLIAVLARAQLTGRQFAIDGRTAQATVVYQSSVETLLWLDGEFWDDVGDLHHLEADERRAARTVHRRLIEFVDGAGSDSDRDPFVLVERFEPYE